MTRKELLNALRELLMNHDFMFDDMDDHAGCQKHTTERMHIRRHLQTCGTIDPEGMTDLINEVAEARDLGSEYTWILKWRV